MIKLRFVQGKDDVSLAIRLQAGVCMPIVPSHVECITPEGLYLGQHMDGGMLARQPGYDKAWLDRDLFLDLPTSDAKTALFYSYCKSQIGQPYDWKAILGFVTMTNDHLPNHAICSAAMTLGLREATWFQWPLAKPAHEISPAMLLTIISGMMEVKH